MKKSDVVKKILETQYKNRGDSLWIPQADKGLAFAPTNIALCKYWGKREFELNLPMTSSLSIALPDKGSMTEISVRDGHEDHVILNDKALAQDSEFVKRIVEFLDLFRPHNQWHLDIQIKMNLPVAAGLASSACGFASFTMALNDLFRWELSTKHLSILARLGSGSASRSLFNGFVEWHAGVQADGMDSFAEKMNYEWPDLRVGILTVSDKKKAMSSREAMQQTVDTSVLYASWPKKVARDLVIIRQALKVKNFSLLGGASESNALGMHATMLSSWPPITFTLPHTLELMQKVWGLRREGLSLFFTQDAGPNLKLLFEKQDENDVKQAFPQVEVVKVFE